MPETVLGERFAEYKQPSTAPAPEIQIFSSMQAAAPPGRALASPRDVAANPDSQVDASGAPRAPSPRLDAAAAKALQVEKASLKAQLVALGGMKLKALAAEPVCADEGGSHWDYALKEMQWMSNDFRMERRWKIQSARKLVRDCERVIDKKETERKRARVLEQARMRKVANGIARAVKKQFWEKVDRDWNLDSDIEDD